MTPQEILRQAVADLATELPGVTFGYIGNIERWGDDRLWFIFLPHPGRVGSDNDSVRIGTTDELAKAVEDWQQLAVRVRRLYFNGTVRQN